MVQAQHLDAGDLLDHRFEERTGRFDQMGAHLLEQVPSLLGRKRLDQLLLGGGQNALQADHEEIAQQMGVNVLRAPAHVVLLKTTDSLRNSGFHFSDRSHLDSLWAKPCTDPSDDDWTNCVCPRNMEVMIPNLADGDSPIAFTSWWRTIVLLEE